MSKTAPTAIREGSPVRTDIIGGQYTVDAKEIDYAALARAIKALNNEEVKIVLEELDGDEIAKAEDYGELAGQVILMSDEHLEEVLKAIDANAHAALHAAPKTGVAPTGEQTDNQMSGAGGQSDLMPMVVSLEAPGQSAGGDYHGHIPLAQFHPMSSPDRAKVHAAAILAASRHQGFQVTPKKIKKDATVFPADNQNGGGSDQGPVEHPSMMTMYQSMQDALNEVGMGGQQDQSWDPQVVFGSTGSAGQGPSPWDDLSSTEWPVDKLTVHDGPRTVHYPLVSSAQVSPESKNAPMPQGAKSTAASKEVTSLGAGQSPSAGAAPVPGTPTQKSQPTASDVHGPNIPMGNVAQRYDPDDDGDDDSTPEGDTDHDYWNVDGTLTPKGKAAGLHKDEFSIEVPILKTDTDLGITYGVVLVPEQVDSQGDVCSKEDIEDAAHGFLANGSQIGVNHLGDPNPDIRVIESYIAPHEVTYAGHRYPEGSWVMAAKFDTASETWADVKSGRLRSWSIQGLGVRDPI